MKVFCAILVTLLLWLGTVVTLCLLPWKVLAVLAGLCMFTAGIGPIALLAIYVLLTFAVWDWAVEL